MENKFTLSERGLPLTFVLFYMYGLYSPYLRNLLFHTLTINKWQSKVNDFSLKVRWSGLSGNSLAPILGRYQGINLNLYKLVFHVSLLYYRIQQQKPEQNLTRIAHEITLLFFDRKCLCDSTNKSLRIFATLMISAGENLGWVQRQMGHSSLKMITEKYYSHIPNFTHNDASLFSEVYAQRSAKTTTKLPQADV